MTKVLVYFHPFRVEGRGGGGIKRKQQENLVSSVAKIADALQITGVYYNIAMRFILSSKIVFVGE